MANSHDSTEPVAWKHDCAALLTNDVELWIDNCPHCGKPRSAPPAQQPQYEAGDMASAHNDGFRAGAASVAQQQQARPDFNDEWTGYLKDGETPFERFLRERKDLNALTKLYQRALEENERLKDQQPQAEAVTENTSDGYHTFKELYAFRKAYNAALFNEWAQTGKCQVHKSWRHHDGELCFGGGWFIVVAVLPDGQISNHYEAKDWELFNIPETAKALYEFDGHTGADVIARLEAYKGAAPQQAEAVATVIEELEHDGQGWCAKVRWLFNPVPVGEMLLWRHQK